MSSEVALSRSQQIPFTRSDLNFMKNIAINYTFLSSDPDTSQEIQKYIRNYPETHERRKMYEAILQANADFEKRCLDEQKINFLASYENSLPFYLRLDGIITDFTNNHKLLSQIIFDAFIVALVGLFHFGILTWIPLIISCVLFIVLSILYAIVVELFTYNDEHVVREYMNLSDQWLKDHNQTNSTEEKKV